MPRLNSCQWVPGPADHVNQYSGYGDTHPKRLVVLHSPLGYWDNISAPVNTMVSRGNSWHITILRNGQRLQHYDTNMICWHGGGGGNIQANLHGIGIEIEGLHKQSDGSGRNDPLTDPQAEAVQTVLRDIWSVHQWNAPQKGVNLYEHRMFSTSSCPTSRWDNYGYWNDLFINFLEDAPMTPQERVEFDALKADLAAFKALVATPEYVNATKAGVYKNLIDQAKADIMGRLKAGNNVVTKGY